MLSDNGDGSDVILSKNDMAVVGKAPETDVISFFDFLQNF